jgi:hypothetical protein
MFSPEIVSLLAGGALGGILKLMAQSQADRQQNFESLLKKDKQDDEMRNNAAQRSYGKAGENTRRFIILIVLFGVILAPFLLTLLQLPTVVEISSPERNFLGLFSWGGKTKLYELYGYLVTPEIRQSALAIIGFYFSVSTMKRSNS